MATIAQTLQTEGTKDLKQLLCYNVFQGALARYNLHPNITIKHALYGIFALYIFKIDARIELACHVIIQGQRLTDLTVGPSLYFSTKIQRTAPDLKPSISRLFCSDCKRFCLFKGSVMHRAVTRFFAASLFNGASTIAVNSSQYEI